MSKIKTFGSHLVDFSIIPDDGVFIDAGACQGNFIDDLLRNVMSPYIFAIEPNKNNYKGLVEKYKYRRLDVFNVALVGSNELKKMTFADFTKVGLPEWGNVTGLYENRRPEYYKVDTMDIRELLAIIPTNTIHHLKMDIEGSEHGVIADLTEKEAKRIQQISMEVHSGLQQMEYHLINLGYNTQFKEGELYAIRKEL
jgi:FkbM family methyltransferase